MGWGVWGAQERHSLFLQPKARILTSLPTPLAAAGANLWVRTENWHFELEA